MQPVENRKDKIHTEGGKSVKSVKCVKCDERAKRVEGNALKTHFV